MKTATKTVIEVDYNDLEEKIKEVYGSLRARFEVRQRSVGRLRPIVECALCRAWTEVPPFVPAGTLAERVVAAEPPLPSPKHRPECPLFDETKETDHGND